MKKIRFISDTWLTPTLLILYLILWKVSVITGLSLQVIPGVLLFFFVPGFYITKIIPVLSLKLGGIGKAGLRVIYTFALFSVLGYITQTIYGFNSESQTVAVIATNLILYLLAMLLPCWKKWSDIRIFEFNSQKNPYTVNRYDFYIIAVAAVLTLVPVLISPMAQNADNYLTLVRNSILSNDNVLTSRHLFSSYIGLSNKFLSIDLKFIFRNIFILLYFSSTLFLYEYLKSKSKNLYVIALGYLFLFIPAVIITEVNIIRPQAIMLIFTLPVIILSMISVEQNKILPAIVSTILAVVSIKYHELGVILLLIALISLLINIYRLIFLKKIINWKHIIVALLLLYSYGRLFALGSMFKTAILFAGKAFSVNNSLTWRWWFLSNYKSIDGINISWQGLQAVNYYLYNGLLALLLISAFSIVILKNKQRMTLSVILPSIYLFIFFFFAEVMPRLGLYFLPNRSWVHLMFAAVIILVVQIIQLEKKIKSEKYWQLALILLIVIGYSGVLYVAKNNIEDVFKEELKVADFIKKDLPENAVVLSSQNNESLISIYAERNYGQLNVVDRIDDKSEFISITDKELDFLSKDQFILTRPLIRQTTESITNNVSTVTSTKVLQEEKFDVKHAIYHDNQEVYFLYSYRKLNGLNGSRAYNQKYIDQINKDVYKNLDFTVAYSDKSTLLLKIK